MKKLLYVSALLCLVLTACEKPEIDSNDNGNDRVTFENPTYAQFSIVFEGGSMGPKPASAPQRVDEPHDDTDAGSASEYGITSVDVIFVATAPTEVELNGAPTTVQDGYICYVRPFGVSDLEPEHPGPGVDHSVEYSTPVFEVAEGTFEVYVVVNAPENVEWKENQLFDLKKVEQVADVTKLTEGIAKSNGFLMTNVLTGAAEVDKGNTVFTLEKRREDEPNIISVDVERVVAKFTYDAGDKTGAQTVKLKAKGTDDEMEGAIAQLTGMQMFNMTKSAYYFKQFSQDGTYVTDPSHGDKTGADKTTFLVNELNKLTSVADGFDKTYYFLENTMAQNEQKFGNTTGMVFRAQYTVTDPAKILRFVGLYDIELTDKTIMDADVADKAFQDTLAAIFMAEMGYTGVEASTAPESQGAAVFRQGYTALKTFYTYNDNMFATPVEVAYYWMVNNDAACAGGVIPVAKLKEIAALASEIATASASEVSAIAYSRKEAVDNGKHIGIYFEAQGYYTIALSNQGTGAYGFDRTDGNMEPMEYCMVRNHWYQMVVSSLNGFGKPLPDIDIDVPVESMGASADVIIRVMPWKVVREEVEL